MWTALWMAVTAAGGMLPPLGPHGFQAGGPGYHLVVFGVLTVLLAQSMPTGRAALAAWLYGLALEAVQSFLPYRGAELQDLGVNLVAVTAGAVAVAILRVWQAR